MDTPEESALTADVFEALDLSPEQFLTDGGLVNRGKLRAAFLYPHDYLPEGHWMRAADSQSPMAEALRETAPPAPLGQVERGVGRPVPEHDDGDLLALAADAAGLRVLSWLQDGYPFVEDVDGKKYGWNPLVFDSDALRLAATLRLTVGDEDQSVRSMAFAYARHRQELLRCYEPSQSDPAAAYRRAIVRAAAALASYKTPDD